MNAERALRAVAVGIAILAVIDPAMTRAERNRQTVVVLHASDGDRGLASDVAAALQESFEVSREPVPHAAAFVVAGADLPRDWRPPAETRVFNITPSAARPGLRILSFETPATASLDSVLPLDIEVQVDGSGERDVTVTLTSEGVVLGQKAERVTGIETRLKVPMTYVPSQAGLVRLRVEAAMSGREAAAADQVVQVTRRVWKVLAFDGRPGYASTFVRRALETDPRFNVSTRVLTSRASAIDTNSAPSTLTDPSRLSEFDLIVIGGLEAFGDSEGASLQRYLRERHGAVILLPESAQDGLLSRMTGQGTWEEERRMERSAVSATVAPASNASEGWTAAEFLWPARYPPLAVPLAAIPMAGRGSAARPVVWQMPVGGGRLAINTAIDGWRSRAGAASGFSAFWRATAATLAQATPPVIDITLSRRLLTPGQWAEVAIGTFTPGEPVAAIVNRASRSAVRLWVAGESQSGTGREWKAAFRAPSEPGRYRFDVAAAGGASSTAEFVVVAADGVDTPREPASSRDGLAALAAASHGGRVLPAEQLAQLPAQLSEAVNASPSPEPWHPMRSVWWLIPFTLCAGGEWWLRRHRGER